MTETSRCSHCGAELDAGASPTGICERCLFEADLSSDPNEAVTVASPPESRCPAPAATSATVTALTEGQSFGSYRIGRLLGKGGMGTVYEATELDNGRRVALKLLTQGLEKTDRERFLREGRLAASVSNPHTVYVFGTDEIQGIPVIAMEMADGGTLKDRVKTEGPLPPAEAVDVILQVIVGLEAASDAGVLHRDIKPSNCFVDRDGTVKVGDFGLSISTLGRDDTWQQVTTTGSLPGTPAFASPEQLRGEVLGLRADIYSVGVTLYYLLTGRLPFEDSNPLQLLTRITQEPPPSPKAWRREIPSSLPRIVMQCLAKNRTHREPSYPALTRRLRPFRPATTPPATVTNRFMASVVDGLMVSVPFLVTFGIDWLLSISLPNLIIGLLVSMLYYAVSEGIWGKSIGKAV